MSAERTAARVVVVGESLMDVLTSPDGTMVERPGGSPANVAYGLARLGCPVRLLTQLGQDSRGQQIHRHLTDAGVDVVNAGAERQHTSTASAFIDPDGSATYSFDLTWDINPPAELGAMAALHVGSLATLVQPGSTAVLDLVRRQRSTSLITYDPNLRPSLTPSRALVRPDVEQFVALADVVKASQEDLAWLYPGRDIAAIAQEWLGRGPALVIVTKGERGAYACNPVTSVELPAFRTAVVDTIGAGDAFMAGLLAGLDDRASLRATARSQIRSADANQLARVLDWAAATAAATVATVGAHLPSREDVAKLLVSAW